MHARQSMPVPHTGRTGSRCLEMGSRPSRSHFQTAGPRAQATQRAAAPRAPPNVSWSATKRLCVLRPGPRELCTRGTFSRGRSIARKHHHRESCDSRAYRRSRHNDCDTCKLNAGAGSEGSFKDVDLHAAIKYSAGRMRHELLIKHAAVGTHDTWSSPSPRQPQRPPRLY